MTHFRTPDIATFANAVSTRRYLNSTRRAMKSGGPRVDVVRREDGTGIKPLDRFFADDAREHYLDRELTGRPAHWKSVARASLFAAFAEKDAAPLRDALIQHAAIISEWVADIDTREG